MFCLVQKHNLLTHAYRLIRQSGYLIGVAKTRIPLKSILLLIYSIFSLVIFPTATLASTNSQLVNNLVISEINPFGSIGTNGCKTNNAGANRCGFDKWIEIHNPGPNSVNLNGWSLQFLESEQKLNNLAFSSNILLPVNGYFLIGYKENQYQSVLNLANTTPGGVTGKIRNLSNRETGRIQVNLVNPQAQKVFTANLRLQDFPDLQASLTSNKRYSLEYTGQQWVVATNEFYPDNFGTPKNTVSLSNSDLDNQQVESLVTNDSAANEPLPNQNTANNWLTENVDATATETLTQPATQPNLQTQTSPAPEFVPDNSPITENNLSKVDSEALTNSDLEPALNTPKLVITKPQISAVASTSQSTQNVTNQLLNKEWLIYPDLNTLLIKQINILQPKVVVLQDKMMLFDQSPSQSSYQLIFADEQGLWDYFVNYRMILLLVLLLFLGLAAGQIEFSVLRESCGIAKWATV